MKLIYNVEDRPKFSQSVVFALQQLLAIMTATLVVPIIIGHGMSSAAALFGAGVGTLVYIAFTKAKSPVFLGSSFAFLGSMGAAFAGAATTAVGYLGLIIGAVFAGLVYVVISFAVRFAGVGWIDKIMPAVVIGPTVTIIGLSLAGNAIGDVVKSGTQTGGFYPSLLVGLVTLAVTMLASTYGKRALKLIPFIVGILAGYAFASILTVIGIAAGIDSIKIINFDIFKTLTADGFGLSTFFSVPDFTFITAFGGFGKISASYIGTVAVAYVPVAFVVFAEHIADHKNLSSIIERDLLKNPGLQNTLLGDGVGSIAGAFFGGCPNTTYGESIGCVAITKNASVISIAYAAIGAIAVSFLSPFVVFVQSIPACIMGGVCIALYGFIAVSGLKMIKDVDLNKNKNLFVVSVILISGVGGLSLSFAAGKITLTSIAVSLILGILTNLMLSKAKDED